MTAREFILKGITDQASSKADEILAHAKAEAAAYLAAAEADTKTYSGRVISAALRQAEAVKVNAKSSANLILRDARLARKIREIDDIINLAVKEICALPDDRYFEIVLGLAANKAENCEGEIFLGAHDLGRNTDYLVNGIKKLGLKLSLSPRPAAISAGFVLKYGDIELNSSFEAIVLEKKDKLEDTINSILFTE